MSKTINSESMNSESVTTESQLTSDVTTPTCPTWAQRLLHEVYLLELDAGHIQNPSQEERWNTTSGADLLRMAERLDAGKNLRDSNEDTIESNLKRVTQGLNAEGLELDEIADLVNALIPTGQKLKYCDASELKQYL